MISKQFFLAIVLVAGLSGILTAAEPTTAPPTATGDVPEQVIENIKANFNFSPDMTVSQARQQLNKAITLGFKVENDYPKAGNLHMVHLQMLKAAVLLTRIETTETNRQRVLEIARKIAADVRAPKEDRLEADFLLLQDKLASEVDVKTVDKNIRDFVARYDEGQTAPMANFYGLLLARQTGRKELADELIDVLKTKYSDDPDVRSLLRRLGHSPDIGKPFKAELATLAGKKLTLPKDLKGKVVVIDFWATWCGPCRAEVPHMKEIYAKYKSKGVEFVGISLDEDKQALEKFVKKNDLTWIQTFGPQNDKTADAYGVQAIPTIWVLDRDGKVVSVNARGKLADVLDETLKQKTDSSSTVEKEK